MPPCSSHACQGGDSNVGRYCQEEAREGGSPSWAHQIYLNMVKGGTSGPQMELPTFLVAVRRRDDVKKTE
jgi:hypothetical protein